MKRFIQGEHRGQGTLLYASGQVIYPALKSQDMVCT
jgi:hypothetical protein